jgi:hypothetical protein
MEDQFDTEVASYPPVYSSYWWYNILAFVFMAGIVSWSISSSTKAILVVFTILSWNMNALRHGINALAPFLTDHHALLKMNHILRFPALVSATITSLIWNLALFPYLFVFLMNTRQKKDNFAAWNTKFCLVQYHVCNVFYAVLNTMVTGNRSTPPLFDEEDLWYGLAYGLACSHFYVLVMDRVGVHLYPIFSPRSKFVAVAWGTGFFLFYGAFLFWNHVISNHWAVLQFHRLLSSNLIIIGMGCLTHEILTRRKKRNKINEREIDEGTRN